MSEDEIRDKKFAEMMAKAQKQQEQENQAEQKISQLLNRFLTDEAKARLNNVRLVNKNLFQNALQSIIYLAQQGQISEKLSDAELKNILERLNEKKDFTIRRK